MNRRDKLLTVAQAFDELGGRRSQDHCRARGEMTSAGQPGDRRLYRVTVAMRLLSLSRSVIYEQIRSGRLRSVTQGRTRLIPATAIAEYIALLEKEAQHP
jgi:excisionase family DNA binding protein